MCYFNLSGAMWSTDTSATLIDNCLCLFTKINMEMQCKGMHKRVLCEHSWLQKKLIITDNNCMLTYEIVRSSQIIVPYCDLQCLMDQFG